MRSRNRTRLLSAVRLRAANWAVNMKVLPRHRRPVWILAGALATAAVGASVAWGLTLRSAMPAIERPANATFSEAQILRGASLAAVGDCAVCHTAERGKSFAGGRALATPFGTLYATNITPDAGTGIGSWSVEAFERAMREGVRRNGDHLYPALPYEHFTKTRTADLEALYAFLMTREAVIRARRRTNSFRRLASDHCWPAGSFSSCVGHRMCRMPRRAPNGTAAVTWSKAWGIAVAVTHRAMCSVRKNPTLR